LVVAICQELGLLYEQEKEKFFEFIEGTSDVEREAIEAELAKLEDEIDPAFEEET
ncbi:unnamed protein product, partial [marine sediment metagenome]